MQIAFDPDKDAANQTKHGISLAVADDFDWESAIQLPDKRKDYGENRHVAHGLIGDRVYCLVFIIRHNALRIISLRKANQREVKHYVEQTQDHYAD